MKIVFAPDSFKGSAQSHDVAHALSEGWLSVRPNDACVLLPMADGGEGTLDVLHAACRGAELVTKIVAGPTGDPVTGRWLRMPDGTAVVELASASGIELLGDRLAPVDADTFGFGQILADAAEQGATRIFAAIGGSSSNDGGAGLLEALGADLGDWKRLPDASDPPLRTDLSSLRELPPHGLVIWSDVINPLLGDSGAIAVFGPQKGVTPELRAPLERRIERIVAAVRASLPDCATLDVQPGSGAAGGAGFGLLVWGGTMAQGATAIGDLIGLPTAIADADLVITGEGRLDGQSENGKVVSAVHTIARESETALAIVAGSIVDTSSVLARDAVYTVSLSDLARSATAAMKDTQRWLHDAGALLADALGSTRTGGS